MSSKSDSIDEILKNTRKEARYGKRVRGGNSDALTFSEAKAKLQALLLREREKEACMWLDMVVKNDRSRLDSNEWYKLNPQVVMKFWADRIAELSRLSGDSHE